MILDRLLDDDAVWRRVLVFAPHPDDESLAAGGVLRRAVERGSAIRVVFATDGENDPWPQRVVERRWRLDGKARARWGARRRDEAVSALATLGIPSSSVRFLHLPDQGLTQLLLQGNAYATNSVAAEIADMRPTLLLASAIADRHPDHGALAVLVDLALTDLPSASRHCLALAYMVHGRPTEPTAVGVVLTPAELARKRAAIRCHATQLALSRRRFLAHATIAERFLVPTVASPRHRVRQVVADHDELRILLTPRESRRLPVPATLDVVAVGADAAVVGRAARVWPHTQEVRIPLSIRPYTVHVRLERPRPFFDRDGWRSFTLPVERHVNAVELLAALPA